MLNARIATRLKELVLNLDRAGVEKATKEALEAGDSPQDIISEGLSRGIEEVGERFERREFFLPELMLSAKVVKAALDIVTLFPLTHQGNSPYTPAPKSEFFSK